MYGVTVCGLFCGLLQYSTMASVRAPECVGSPTCSPSPGSRGPAMRVPRCAWLARQHPLLWISWLGTKSVAEPEAVLCHVHVQYSNISILCSSRIFLGPSSDFVLAVAQSWRQWEQYVDER